MSISAFYAFFNPITLVFGREGENYNLRLDSFTFYSLGGQLGHWHVGRASMGMLLPRGGLSSSPCGSELNMPWQKEKRVLQTFLTPIMVTAKRHMAFKAIK